MQQIQPRRAARRSRQILLTAIAVALPSCTAFAQTSSTWNVDVGTTGGNWSNTANWQSGIVPGNGGTASFITLPSFTTAPVNILQDSATVTLSGITFDGFITYLLKPSVAGNTI